MNPQKIINVETLSYYGKKQYHLAPFIARKKKLREKTLEYTDVDPNPPNNY